MRINAEVGLLLYDSPELSKPKHEAVQESAEYDPLEPKQ